MNRSSEILFVGLCEYCTGCAGPGIKAALCCCPLLRSRAGGASASLSYTNLVTRAVLEIFFKLVISTKHHRKAIPFKQIVSPEFQKP